MKNALTHRVAPILLLMQAAYLALLEFAFAFLAPETGEIDHTEPAGSSGIVYALVVGAAFLGLIGGAALLGSVQARARTAGRPLRVVWLALLGLGELAVAGMFLKSIVDESVGPDTVIGMLAIVISCGVGICCFDESRKAIRRTPRASA
jgi:hypothetical protein